MVGHARDTALPRRSARGGHSAAEHMFNALRALYTHAVRAEVLHPDANPMRTLKKPTRPASRRRGLPHDLVTQITTIASTTGDDPALDALLIRFHLETAARRGGALALRLGDLDRSQSLVLLREKGGATRWQPVSPTLMTHLADHAHHRGARHDDSPVLRYHNGKPLTTRRYDHLWTRIGHHIDPVRTHLISTHWLRHTALSALTDEPHPLAITELASG